MQNASSSEQPIRILIADDQELSRSGLSSFFRSENAFAIVGEASDGESAVRLCCTLRPDILFLDIRLGSSDGLQVARTIRESCAETHIIMVTMHDDEQYLVEAMKVGARGYLLKDAPRSEFLSTTRRVMRGEMAFNPQLMARAIYSLAKLSPVGVTSTVEPLTAREQDVLTLITGGQTNRQIAAALQISPGTVKVHVEHIIAKLGVTDRTQAAVRAIEFGLITPQRGEQQR